MEAHEAGSRAAPSSSRRPFLLAAGGGVLHFLGFAGFGIWPLALICLAPLWRGLEQTRGRLAAATLVGFTFGWVSYAGGYVWLWRIVDVFLAGNVVLGGLIWLADSAWFALRYALYAALYCSLRRRWSVALAAVPPLLVVEWLYPLLFPVYLGHALAERTTLVQMSDLGGPLLLSAFAATLNLTAFETWRWIRGERALPAAVGTFAALALGAAWVYGATRIAEIERAGAGAPALRVGIVQGNLGVHEKGNEAALDHRRYLEQTRELLAEGDVDLVVWPETVYTRGLRGPLPISGDLVRQELRVPLLFGAAFVRGESGRRLAYNSALLVGADGVIRDLYEKNLLIPFTEYVPFAGLAPSIGERFVRASHFTAAGETPPLSLGPWRMVTPICYEAVRPTFVRRMVTEAKPHLLVTLANDAWFGDSQGPWLHLAMAKLRAIEHRRYMVRATNSGVSAVIDPAGREVVRAGLLTRENLRATVRMLDRPTVYTRYGDWVGLLSAAIVVVASVLRRGGSGVSQERIQNSESRIQEGD
jgi:apolipoprotein N-acyltransferase